ncbi:hypothetical protein [Fodinicola acaciae]|uniref:hypothetical protein n=1 Tax=Fodinicola acaciae TaxID=2681555 RepID=UPI0013D0B82A|nr:hypothetical protein [Fodinicola acaciae]
MAPETVADRWAIDARRSAVPEIDAVLLALNVYGLCTPLGTRVRLQLSVPVGGPVRTVVVPAGRRSSPFTLSYDGVLFVDGVPIGRATRMDVDDAVSGYLRCWHNGAWRAATINPASRSKCTGCAFCPTALEPSADPKLTTDAELHALLDGLEKQLPEHGTLTDLEEVTVSTACYESEDAALEAMMVLRKILRSRHINTRIVLLSSVVRSREAFRWLAEHVAPFGLFLTAECVTRRDLLLKNTKADLMPELMPALLADARQAGLDTSFTYIVGLDATKDMEPFLSAMLPQVTLFPSLQVFQSHTPVMDGLRTSEADELRYFLNARRIVESIMTDVASDLAPESWRCYRSLWYESYAGLPLVGPRR